MLHRKNSSMVTYLISVYLIQVDVDFIIVKNSGFVKGIVILAIHYPLTNISNFFRLFNGFSLA